MPKASVSTGDIVRLACHMSGTLEMESLEMFMWHFSRCNPRARFQKGTRGLISFHVVLCVCADGGKMFVG